MLSLICVSLAVMGHPTGIAGRLGTTQGGGQGSETVTLSTGVVTLPKALEALSQATGEAYSASKLLENEVVYLRVHDMPKRELLDRIASVSMGHWQDSGEFKVLMLDQTAVSKREAEERKLAEETIRREALAYDKPDISKPWDEQRGRLMEALAIETAERRRSLSDRDFEESPAFKEVMASLPGRRAIYRLLNQSSLPKLMAGMAAGEARTFSNVPNKMQTAMPADAVATIRLYEQEQTAFTDARRRLSEAAASEVGHYARDVDEGLAKRPTVITTRFVRGLNAMFWEQVTSIDGSTIHISNAVPAVQPFLTPVQLEAETSWRNLPFPASPELETLKTELRFYSDPAAPHSPLKDIVGVEPLSFLVGALLVRAFSPEDNVVALVSDEIAFVGLWGRYPRTLGDISDSFFQCHKLTRQSRILTIEPLFAAESHRLRCDRKKLRSLIQQARKSGSVPLRAIFAYVAQQGEGGAQTGFERLALGLSGMLQCPWWSDADSTVGGSRSTLVLASTFSSRQWASLNAGNRLALADLTRAQRSLLEKTVFSSIGYLNCNVSAMEDHDTPEPGEDVTIRYPDGLPKETALELTKDSFEMEFILRDGVYHVASPLAASEPAMAGEGGAKSPKPSEEKRVRGTMTNQWLTIHLGKGVDVDLSLREIAVPPR